MRTLTPEILDHLPADHPDAIASRRDLRWINRIMGNHRWLARRILSHLRDGDTIVEPGAGDGSLARALRQRVAPGQSFRYHAIDRAPAPADWPDDPRFVWIRGDLRDHPALANAGIVAANLIFHHFTDDELARIGSQLGRTRVVLAREPARQSAWMRHSLRILRLNRVTLHDMKASIEAGFLGRELAQALGLTSPGRITSTGETIFNAHWLESLLRE